MFDEAREYYRTRCACKCGQEVEDGLVPPLASPACKERWIERHAIHQLDAANAEAEPEAAVPEMSASSPVAPSIRPAPVVEVAVRPIVEVRPQPSFLRRILRLDGREFRIWN